MNYIDALSEMQQKKINFFNAIFFYVGKFSNLYFFIIYSLFLTTLKKN